MPLNELSDSNPTPTSPSEAKKPYHKPTLVHFGDVRDLTLSPSPGTFESGLGLGKMS